MDFETIEGILNINLNSTTTLALAALLLIMGYSINKRVTILNKYCIPAPVVGGFIASGVAFMVAAISYLLMGVKIKKRGVFTISGTLLGLIALSGGHIPHAIFAILGGIICDFIVGDYENKGRNWN